VRVVVADDSMLTREGIGHVLTLAGLDVVGQAVDGRELLRMVAFEHPDAAIVDVRMPPTHTDEGVVAAQRILADFPGVAVLLLSQYIEPGYALRLLAERPDGVGYLLKDRVFDPVLLVDALRRLVDGESVIDPSIVKELLSSPSRSDSLRALSERELDVLGLIAEGLSNQAIATRLGIAERTVEAHVTRILPKLGISDGPDVHRRVLAALAYVEGNRK
jgi:DNA-binding NarL/FixJ family response regulator